MPIEVTNVNFKEEVLASDKLVLVDFWTHGCGPCRHIAPILDKLDKEFEDVKICKVNAAENLELSKAYGVSAVPTLLYFRKGALVKREVGFKTEQSLKEQFAFLKSAE